MIIFRVCTISIRSSIEVVYDEILQKLAHCKSSVKLLRSWSKHDKMIMLLGRKKFCDTKVRMQLKVMFTQYSPNQHVISMVKTLFIVKHCTSLLEYIRDLS